ncbi:hypothetical protein, partial [Acidocella aminolytica]|uniref:hypothetical protein n=1 Tax=Acidocella aminolytica TaxID=33998 RepID=UPI0022313DAF
AQAGLQLNLPEQNNNLLRAHPFRRHANASCLNQFVSIQLVQKSPGRPTAIFSFSKVPGGPALSRNR